MKTRETRTVTRVDTLVRSVTCDLCGKTTAGPTWGNDVWERTEVRVELEERRHVPGGYAGGTDHRLALDLCPDCFRDRLVPWVKAQAPSPGVPEEERWEWD